MPNAEVATTTSTARVENCSCAAFRSSALMAPWYAATVRPASASSAAYRVVSARVAT